MILEKNKMSDNKIIDRYVPISQEKYDKLLSEGKIRNDILYVIPEDNIWIKILEELKEIKQLIKEIRK